jgi:hypothetical protein
MSDTDFSVSASSGSDVCDTLLVVDVVGTPKSLTAGKDWVVLLCVAKWGTFLAL